MLVLIPHLGKPRNACLCSPPGRSSSLRDGRARTSWSSQHASHSSRAHT